MVTQSTYQPYDGLASYSDISKGFIIAFLPLLCLCNHTRKCSLCPWRGPQLTSGSPHLQVSARLLEKSSPYARTACWLQTNTALVERQDTQRVLCPAPTKSQSARHQSRILRPGWGRTDHAYPKNLGTTPGAFCRARAVILTGK